MAVALVATLVLEGRDRRFALRVLGFYTAASLVLNYDHGLMPGIHAGTGHHLADWSPANWALVLLATSLPVGSIYFGSDLVAKVLHHKPTAAAETPAAAPAPLAAPTPNATAAAASVYLPKPAPLPALPAPKPRKRTGKKSAPPARRTLPELLAEARQLAPDQTRSAEALRVALRCSAANARAVRDALAAEQAPTAAPDCTP
ncbi:hypothetical protein ACFQZC_20590 [Streptacidiphilus monticola]